MKFDTKFIQHVDERLIKSALLAELQETVNTTAKFLLEFLLRLFIISADEAMMIYSST